MNTKARVFAYLEQHPDTDNATLYEAMPDVSHGVLRTYAAKFRNPDTTPADPRQISILGESDTPSPPPRASKPDPDLDWLKANRKALERVLSKQNASTSISSPKSTLDGEISGPVRVRSYSIAENVHREFVQAAQRQGLSQRRAVHAALRLFVQASR